GITVFTAANEARTAAFDWNTSIYAAGPHTLLLTVKDQSGTSTTSDPRRVTVAEPLAASIMTPAEGATVTGTVPVGMSESNGTGTITWTLRVDGGSTPIFTTSGTAP